MDERERNYGLDLFRIVSMYMIVVLHVLGQGGAMVRLSSFHSTYYGAWFLETCAYCSVNCYGLLSGYLGYGKKFRPDRYMELWLQVFFYTMGIYLAAGALHTEWLEAGSLWKALFPVGWKSYWYFSAYTGVFFISPLLNRLAGTLTEREMKLTGLVFFLLFCVSTAIPRVNSSDYLNLGGGYSFVWLSILYLTGAMIRRSSFTRRRKRTYLAAYLLMAAFSWIFKILMENYTREKLGEPKFGRVFTSFTAPTIFLCAVCLLLIFEQIRVRNRAWIWLIRLLSPLTFSVYLIHTNPLIFNNPLKGAFKAWRTWPVPRLFGAVLGTALLIYLGCSMIDLVRDRLFRLLRVRTCCRYVADRIGSLVESRL